MKTEGLIDLLVEDAPSHRRLGIAYALATACSVVFVGAVFFATIGVRPDFSRAAETWRFLFKFAVTLPLAAAAVGAALRTGRPDARTGYWAWPLVAVPLVLAGAVATELASIPSGSLAARLVGRNALDCLTLIPLLAIGPLACLIAALRGGAPSHPGLTGAFAGLAASGIAATFYASNCTDDSPLFVATWYPLATGLVVLAGYLAGVRLLRW